MFKTNLKIAWRNFWKNKRYTLLNVGGLCIALTLLLVALVYVNHEKQVDKWNPGHEGIYRIAYSEDKSSVVPLAPAPFVSVLRQLPVTEVATSAQDYWYGEILMGYGDKQLYVSNIIQVDSSFLDVFQYPMLYGDRTQALRDPLTLVLSKRMSETIFGKDVNPVGQQVMVNAKKLRTVTGVIDTDKYPSHFKFDCLLRTKMNTTNWYSNNNFTYVRCKPGTHPEAYRTQLNNDYAAGALSASMKDADAKPMTAEDAARFRKSMADRGYYFQPVDEIHLNSHAQYEAGGNGNGRYLYLLMLVAVIIVLVAAINFTNLSIAYATRRAKETGLRKVMGAERKHLVFQFLLETFMQCLFAFLLAFVFAEAAIPMLNSQLGIAISMWNPQYGPFLVWEFLASLVGITLLAGFYPALVVSGYAPALVLKGSFSEGIRGVTLRRYLMVVQFVVASVFIGGIIIMFQQMNYMKRMDLGYKAQQVLTVKIQGDSTNGQFSNLRQRLLSIPGVQAVSRTSHIPGQGGGGNEYGYEGRKIESNFYSVDATYFKAMGANLLAGREFDGLHAIDTTGSIVINETFARQLGLKDPVGKFIQGYETQLKVIGLVKDFHYLGPQDAISPLAFQFHRGNPMVFVLIRFDAGKATDVLGAVQKEWGRVEPLFPMKYYFLDQHFANMFQGQEKMSLLFSIFTCMALLIAVMGLVALAAYTAERKTKEISIRKVLGASVQEILTLLNAGFLKWVLIANVLALPLTWLLAHEWLKGYAYRIQMSWVPFTVAIVGSVLLTIAIVTLQSLKATLASPIKALKYE